MQILKVVSTLLLGLSMSSVLAAPHDKSLEACRAATLDAVGDAKVRLSDLDRKGKTYNIWLNVVIAEETGAKQHRAFCKAKGRNVLDLVTMEGTWNKSSKREAAQQATRRLASK